MRKNNDLVAALVVLVVVGVVGMAVYGLVHLFGASSGRGGTSNADEIQLDSDLAASTFVQAVSNFVLGGTRGTNGSGLQIYPKIFSSCNTASTTLFAAKPPSGATSTVDVGLLNLGGNATTTSVYVGTSTTPSPPASSNVSATLVNGAQVATNTVQWLSPGVTVGPANGFLSSGTGTFTSIVVGPNDWLVMWATSTATGAGAAQYTPGFSTCNGKFIFNS